MKTKGIIWMMLAVLASVMFSGCDKTQQEPVKVEEPKQEPPKEDKANKDSPQNTEKQGDTPKDNPTKEEEPKGGDGPLDGHATYFDHVFYEVKKLSHLQIEIIHQPDDRQMPGGSRSRVYLDFIGTIYKELDGTATPPLAEFRKRVGDVYRANHYYAWYPQALTTLLYGFKSFSIETLGIYNERYPAGAKLNPIIEVMYISYDALFKRLLAGETQNLLEDPSCYYKKLIEPLEDCSIPSLRGVIFRFLEAPSQPRVKLRFVVTFDNGSQLELTKEVEIREAS